MEEWEKDLPPHPSEWAMQVAARCWCDPETEMVEMDSRLAMAFAKRLHALQYLLDTALEEINERDIQEITDDADETYD